MKTARENVLSTQVRREIWLWERVHGKKVLKWNGKWYSEEDLENKKLQAIIKGDSLRKELGLI